jgi:hypothetical protein
MQWRRRPSTDALAWCASSFPFFAIQQDNDLTSALLFYEILDPLSFLAPTVVSAAWLRADPSFYGYPWHYDYDFQHRSSWLYEGNGPAAPLREFCSLLARTNRSATPAGLTCLSLFSRALDSMTLCNSGDYVVVDSVSHCPCFCC